MRIASGVHGAIRFFLQAASTISSDVRSDRKFWTGLVYVSSDGLGRRKRAQRSDTRITIGGADRCVEIAGIRIPSTDPT